MRVICTAGVFLLCGMLAGPALTEPAQTKPQPKPPPKWKVHLEDGKKLHQKGNAKGATDHFTKAFQASPKEEKGKIALALGNLYNAGLKKGEGGKLGPKDPVVDWYRKVLEHGNKEEKALAANNLAVLHLDKGNKNLYNPQQAVKLFIDYVFKQQIPEVPDVFAYHYNFGHALALVGNTDQARRQYWFTVDRRPRFTRGVVALRDLIALAEGADRYKDGNRLIDKLLVTGQTELARDTLYLLLDRWGGAKGVEAFLPSWVRYYADARVTPERYREEELQRLTPLRKRPRLAALAAEFDRVFLPDHFKKVAGDRVLLLLRSDQLFKHLPSWRGVLVAAKAPEADYQALGRMLTTAGDSFRAAGLRQNEPPDRAEAFRQAAVRYSGAYAAAPSNASAALNLLSLLFEQAPLLDPKGQLFEQTVRALFDPKGMPVRAADLEGTHALFAMHSLVIDWMNEGRRKDGSVGGPLSLLFHATKAVELEDRIRKNDPQFRAPRRYSSRLPARRSAPGVARRPSTPASVPASAGWRQGTANWPLASCSGRTC